MGKNTFLDTLEELITPSIVGMVEEEYNPYLVVWLQEETRKLGKASDRPDLKWTASAIPGKTVNSFATVGGNIYVFDGLLNNFSKDIVCGVLGHEVAHSARYHCIDSVLTSYGIDYISGLVAQEKYQKLAKIVLEVIWRGYGRKMEFEADKYAVDYNYKAGLYPFGIKKFMEWVVSVEKEPLDGLKQSISELLSTHPPATERLEKINEEIARLGITEEIAGWEGWKKTLAWLAPLVSITAGAGIAYALKEKKQNRTLTRRR